VPRCQARMTAQQLFLGHPVPQFGRNPPSPAASSADCFFESHW
jgi:hypothetical protein